MDGVRFTITLSGAASDHDEDLGDAALDLRKELSELAGVRVEPAPGAASVRPTRSPNDYAAYAGLAVVIGTTVVRPTVDALKAWLNRHKDKSVTVETEDGTKYEMNGYAGPDAERLIAATDRRHSGSAHSGGEPVVGD